MPAPLPRQLVPVRRHHGHGLSHIVEPRPASQTAGDDIGPPDSGGPYRTLCVRACDGFYFPLRHDARRQSFAPDIKSCRTACGDTARLFYFLENGGSVETMVDLAGRKYAELPQAFAYRKALVPGCACKPVPWSGEEAERHQGYAITEAAKNAAEVSREMNAEAIVAEREVVKPQPSLAPRHQGRIDTSAVALSPDAPAPADLQTAEATAAPESYEPVRSERAIQRRRTSRVQRIRAAGAGFRPIPASTWVKPAKPGLFWSSSTR